MSGENQVTKPALDSSVSAEVMRLGFEAARQTVIKRGPMLITAHSASLTIRCISNAAVKPSRLDAGLKPPDNSQSSHQNFIDCPGWGVLKYRRTVEEKWQMSIGSLTPQEG